MAIDEIDVMSLVDREVERRAQPRPPAGSRRPLFLFFKKGHRALIRPLYNLPQAIVLRKHNKWNQEPNLRVNAICAQEEGKSCLYCVRAEQESDKKLLSQTVLYVPIYVYSVIDAAGQAVTYDEYSESGEKETKPIKGVRLLELTLNGTAFQILSQFRDMVRDQAYEHTITGCDFTVTQIGEGTDKSFTVTPKPPKQMHPTIQGLIPKREVLRQRILEALPPFIQTEASGGGNGSAANDGSDDDVPEF